MFTRDTHTIRKESVLSFVCEFSFDYYFHRNAIERIILDPYNPSVHPSDGDHRCSSCSASSTCGDSSQPHALWQAHPDPDSKVHVANMGPIWVQQIGQPHANFLYTRIKVIDLSARGVDDWEISRSISRIVEICFHFGVWLADNRAINQSGAML